MSTRTLEETADLMRLHSPMGVPMPAYDGASIANVLPSVFQGLGRSPSPGPALAPPLRPGLNPFSSRPPDGPVVVLLVDGFGWNAEQEWLRTTRDPVARGWSALSHPITTVFPTTTTAALTSLYTGTPPSRNGVVGYRQFLPRYGLMADLLKMSPLGIPTPGTLIGPEWSPDMISAARPVFQRGLHGAVVTREGFEGTGLSHVLYDGAEFAGYVTASELAHNLIEILRRPDPPELVLAYWDELDTVQHRLGPTSTVFGFEADRIAHLVAHVARELPADRRRSTTLMVTGDHGQVPSAREHQIRVDRIPEITQELAYPMGGDRRCGYFGARPGRIPALRAALEHYLPSGSKILPMEEALEAGLFGPPPYHPEVHQRLGDLLALIPVPYGLVFLVPGASPAKRHLEGSHGGLEASELLVPLVSGRLAEFVPTQ